MHPVREVLFYIHVDHYFHPHLFQLNIDIEFAEGFGFGLGRSFPSLDESYRQEIQKSNELAMGLGLGIGKTFHH